MKTVYVITFTGGFFWHPDEEVAKKIHQDELRNDPRARLFTHKTKHTEADRITEELEQVA